MAHETTPAARSRPITTCHVTGGLVLQRPEWTDVRFGDGYSVTIRLIGGDIIVSTPSGSATMPEVARALNLVSELVRTEIGELRPFAYVVDLSLLRGATREARTYYVDFVQSLPNLSCVVFCGAPRVLKIAVQLAQRFQEVDTQIVFADTVDDAIATARTLLDGTEPRSGPGRPIDGAAGLEASSESRPDWQVRCADFAVTWHLIDGHIMHGAPRGYLAVDHVKPIREVTDRVVDSVRRSGRRPSIVVDLSGLAGTTLAGRRRFVTEFREWLRSDPFDRFAFYGANALVRGALAVWRPFLPERVIMVRDLDSALAALRTGRPRPRRRRFASLLRGGRASAHTQDQVEDLLRFLSSIAWEERGEVPRDFALPPDHPMVPVFDAVTLIKSDVDQLFQERRAAEAALRQSEERYRNIVDNIVEGYYEVDEAGTITFCNDAMGWVLGLDRESLVGRTARELVAKENAGQVMSDLRRVMETGRPAKALDWVFVRSDGSRVPVEVSVALKRTPDGTPAGFRGIVRDVTDRVHAEQQREELEIRLRHAQRMEAIGTLAGGIAHNFNNLLMGIQGNASLIGTQLGPDHAIHSRLETIEELVQAGSRLTAQLLGYARAGRFEVHPIDLNHLVRQTANTFAMTRKEIRVHQQLSEQPLPVRVDLGQIEQVLLNLFVNAAEAMPDGGDLHVATSITTDKAMQGRQYRPKEGDYVHLSVRDTGVGMDEDTVLRVFDPFFTTKGMSGGTGLGLASVYGTVKAHGGYVEVASEVGGGSTFSVFLPVTEETIPVGGEQVEQVMLGRGTVLVVDDDGAVLEACASILSYLRYTPICAATGGRAIELYRARSAEIDLVILDMILPDVSGSELFDEIRAVDPAAKVLLASGYSIDGQAERILERGCNDFIQKPFTIEELSQKIGSVLGSA